MPQPGQYTGPGQVVRETDYSVCVEYAGHAYVFFKGTKASNISEWYEDVRAGLGGERIAAWDKELQFYMDNYGMESDYVTYTGFSRGAPLAGVLGGTMYGLGKHGFPQYPPAPGAKVYDGVTDRVHDYVLTPIVEGAGALIKGGSDINNWHPISGPHASLGFKADRDPGKRGRHDMHELPDAKRQKTNPVCTPGDFSGLVSTFLYPTTGGIINYKGIPRKRKFTSLERYSPFWKEQMRLTQTSVLAGPS